MTLQRIGRSEAAKRIWAAGNPQFADEDTIDDRRRRASECGGYRLPQVVGGRLRRITLEPNRFDGLSPCKRIIAEVAEESGIPVSDIMSDNRHRRVCWARWEAMYRCACETNHSLPVLAKIFGGKDHTTIGYGIAQFCKRFNRTPPRNMAAESYRRAA